MHHLLETYPQEDPHPGGMGHLRAETALGAESLGVEGTIEAVEAEEEEALEAEEDLAGAISEEEEEVAETWEDLEAEAQRWTNLRTSELLGEWQRMPT